MIKQILLILSIVICTSCSTISSSKPYNTPFINTDDTIQLQQGMNKSSVLAKIGYPLYVKSGVNNTIIGNPVDWDFDKSIWYNNDNQTTITNGIIPNSIQVKSVSSGQTYNNDTNDQMPDGVHDPDTGKNIISYRGSSAHGYCRTATLSGTTFTFGTEYKFSTDSVNYPRIEYDSAGSKKFLITYTPYYNSQQWGESIIATLTGDVITYGTKYVFSNDTASASTYASLTYSPDSQSFVAVYRGTDFPSSPSGAAYFVENIRSSNVTAGNYVGIANASYTNGQTAAVSIPGAVNTAVSGLTVGQKYYVLANGTLNTTADDANIVAGNTVAANKLIVR